MNRSERKKQLIAEGALHRAQAVLAIGDLRQTLRPKSLATMALPAVGVALSLFRQRGSAHAHASTETRAALPSILGAVATTLLAGGNAKRRPYMTALIGALVTVLPLLLRKKQPAAPTPPSSGHVP